MLAGLCEAAPSAATNGQQVQLALNAGDVGSPHGKRGNAEDAEASVSLQLRERNYMECCLDFAVLLYILLRL